MPDDLSYRVRSDRPFLTTLWVLAGSYLGLIGLMVGAMFVYEPHEYLVATPYSDLKSAPAVPTVPFRLEESVAAWAIATDLESDLPRATRETIRSGVWLRTGQIPEHPAGTLTAVRPGTVRTEGERTYLDLAVYAQPGKERSFVIAARLVVDEPIDCQVHTEGARRVRFWLSGREIKQRARVTLAAGVYALVGEGALPPAEKLGTTAPVALRFAPPQGPLAEALATPEIRYSTMLSVVSCTLSALLSLWVAVPIGYIMSRFRFRGKAVLDTLLDVPIVLPPLVVGICLLILFNYRPFFWASEWVVYEIPAVILAQFMVACAFAVRTMRVAFDQIPTRYEDVAMTLGCNRSQAFWSVIFPQARQGVLAAGTLAWARSLGEFGPILVFAGATPMRTEVLPSSVYLQLQAGNMGGVLAVSLIMMTLAALVLITTRALGLRTLYG